MQRPDREQDTRRRLLPAAWLPAVAAIFIMLTGFLSTLMVLRLDQFRPKVGDFVVFRPGAQDPDMWQITVAAADVGGIQGGRTCDLDPNVMSQHGGSLVVESRVESDPPLYRLHWAGDHTATAGHDCGGSVDLTLSRVDLQKLANAAGGFGIAHKGLRLN